TKLDIIVQTIKDLNSALIKNKIRFQDKADNIIHGMKCLRLGIVLTVIYLTIYCFKLLTG
ncbi:MAG: hypothetical protein LBU40_02270, partial [Methanobrevibacter sp.]|nr:hypothetical protein [Methanobrevibacter sp.]